MSIYNENMTIVLDGNDGTGKSTIAKMLKEAGYANVKDRGAPTKATVKGVPKEIPQNEIYFILDVPEEVSRDRIAKRGENLEEYWHTWEALVLYRAKFREVASGFNAYMIDATQTPQLVFQNILDILTGADKSETKRVPNVNNFTQEEFDKLPLICEGESKIVRLLGKAPGAGGKDLVLIQFKPTVYSWTYNRAGTIEETDAVRMKCTRFLLDPIRAAGIKHCYWAVGDKFVLSEKIENPPPIEIIVKDYHVGTPKHRYYGMHDTRVRSSHPSLAGLKIADNEKYPSTIVRFDWRNPMKHPKTGERLADEPLSEDMANWYMDAAKTKITANKCFKALANFMDERNIVLKDICFMIAEDGETVYGEISQDCGRYQYKKEDQLDSLDKDVWRAGGSSELVLEKWKRLLQIFEENPWKETH